MNEDMKKVFSDFKLYKKVDKDIIDKYSDIVGNDVIKIWKNMALALHFMDI